MVQSQEDSQAHEQLVDLEQRLTSRIDELLVTQKHHQQFLEDLDSGLGDLVRGHSYLTVETLVGMGLVGLQSGSSTAATDPDSTAIEFNSKILRALEWQIVRRECSGDWAGTLRVARAAAEWSCFHHPGRFVSPPIERSLALAGRALTAGIGPRSHSTGVERVLHVLTCASPIGGHTRLVTRWMSHDPDRGHAAILTEQEEAPPLLARAATLGVSSIVHLAPEDAVRKLRAEMLRYDRIVLHVHPFDAVAVAACAEPFDRPPTVFVDHGDHLFWLGVGASDVVVSVRPSGRSLALERRGVRPESSTILPIPLEETARVRSRTDAKLVLGLPSDALVMVTMASSQKYSVVGDLNFAEASSEVLERVSSSQLIAIGPLAESSPWRELIGRFPDRVHVPGPTENPKSVLEAADLYLDSFPFASLTSLMEASLLETPAICLAPEGAGTLASDDADLTFISTTNRSEWVEAVIRYLGDAGLRSKDGKSIAQALLLAHTGNRWKTSLESAYRQAQHQAALPEAPVDASTSSQDKALCAFLDASGMGRDLEILLAANGLLPGNLT